MLNYDLKPIVTKTMVQCLARSHKPHKKVARSKIITTVNKKVAILQLLVSILHQLYLELVRILMGNAVLMALLVHQILMKLGHFRIPSILVVSLMK